MVMLQNKGNALLFVFPEGWGGNALFFLQHSTSSHLTVQLLSHFSDLEHFAALLRS